MSIITSIREFLAPKPAPVVPVARAYEHDDADAVEPELLRCYYCKYVHIAQAETTHDEGCIECGSRRMRNVGVVTDEEMRDLIARGFDSTNWQWEADDVRLARIAAKREIDAKFQIKKAVTKEREDNLRKRDALAGRSVHVLG